MKEKIQQSFYELSYYAEIIISMVIYIIIAIGITRMTVDLFNPDISWYNDEALNYFLNRALLLAVATELIKMLCRHTAGSVMDVLLFATARQMVVEHYTPVETLISVIAMMCLFAARKFLLNESDKKREKNYKSDAGDNSDKDKKQEKENNNKEGVNFL